MAKGRSKNDPEIFVSTDIESDGPIPGPHSMLSFGSAAFDDSGTLLGTFTRNLETLEGAAGHATTMAWWETQPDAWSACRADLVAPAAALTEYVAWLDALPGRPVFVAYPTGFDFTFVYWYLMRFVGRSPFAHRALDVRSFAMAELRSTFQRAGKEHMPPAWFGGPRHSHVALDDALEQGELFCNLLRANRSKP